MRTSFLLIILLFTSYGVLPNAGIYSTDTGVIAFRSDAPLEVIKASSKKLSGRIDEIKRTFAFQVPVRSFEGFNSGLQQIHFNENYLETDKYPDATFSGKIIEPIDFSKPGKITIRAKGMLKIHGIEQERIIKSDITVTGSRIHIESFFTIQLADHGIRIPKVVHEKIASEIKVNVTADLEP
jgi:polyisoprenoid-binding protein YceI